jgi:hypothetical protein
MSTIKIVSTTIAAGLAHSRQLFLAVLAASAGPDRTGCLRGANVVMRRRDVPSG